jgi:hypothetical protein
VLDHQSINNAHLLKLLSVCTPKWLKCHIIKLFLEDKSSHSSLLFYPEGEGRTVNVLLEIFILSRY